MKVKYPNLIAVALLLFSGIALAADETESMAQPMAEPMAQPAEPASSSAAEEPQPPPYLSSSNRDIPTKTNRSKSLDLRYCLELKTYQEIARCAGE
ncbi:MAG: hypothetical protein HZB47_06485 [Nitrosomonadales bacterium]|nr:hypothetical protein [Nitrosomonadales bacterium]